MLLNWPHNHLEEQHLLHWITLSKRDEPFLQSTLELLEQLKEIWISEEEYRQLKVLIQRDEIDLLYRYLDLQLSYRNAKDKEILHDSIDLERQLDLYIKNPQKSHFLLEIGIRCIQHVLYNWFLSLNLDLPEEFRNLKEADLTNKIQRILEDILKKQSVCLAIRDKLFLEEFLKGLQTNKNDLDYLNRFCSSLEQLNGWESTLQDLQSELKDLLASKNSDKKTDFSKEDLELFADQLTGFHKHLGKHLFSTIFPVFSELQQAIAIGKFRALFQQLNDLYGACKFALFGQQSEEHICCMCHFSENIHDFWTINNQVIEVATENVQPADALHAKRSVLIFTCGGGKGHLSTTQAMSQYAQGYYHILVASTLEETLASTDFFKKFLLDFSHEKLYNHLLKNEEFEWLKLVTSLGPFFIMLQQENIERLIRLEVLKQNPDMIVSCFPVMNAMFLNVAKELNIPLLIVTTDLDTSLFIKGMDSSNCDLNYPLYRVTLAYEDPEMRAILEKKIPSERIHVSGFPVRAAFQRSLSQIEKNGVRARFGAGEKDLVFLIMMGGNAGQATERYAEILASYIDEELDYLEKDAHFSAIFLCGDQKILQNRQMLSRIEKMRPKASRLKFLPVPQTEAIADLMSIADLMITKPGGCSSNEAIAKRLPMIFHAPFALMDWEQFNMKFCLKKRMGLRFKMSQRMPIFGNRLLKNKKQLLPLLKQALERKKELNESTDLTLLQAKSFHTEFLYLVDSLLSSADSLRFK